ncbi:DNA oxidative demethylase AlkB [Pseudidiomarina aestuarii]|uniref:DNA oxidative demethylase AlkB n=1 Tax=Pseudidiomarina aestuarii TaxID=624146 RepID=A0A7Z6ZVX1_9GAMM|nr:DNA oxidative demethylase AlkB [Pseudidiomarina aestuarii]RUO42257.1 DNA oxidative demethylase AlkB [Pseudidiomarina aestuarii]
MMQRWSADTLHWKGLARRYEKELMHAVETVFADAPPRQLQTPGGKTMSAAMTNSGDYGWVSDRKGYRYETKDPLSGRPWPTLPNVFHVLAEQAAAAAGYPDFRPDVALINQYQPGTAMGLHQDRDEADFTQPIVSISLGLPVIFLWGGLQRRDKPEQHLLEHGDVLVWGGADRLRFHGVKKLAKGTHPLCGQQRINITLRRAR